VLELVLRAFAGSAILPASADGDASKAQQTAAARKRLIPSFVSSVRVVGFRLLRVDVEIRPEPGRDEREAILAVLEQLLERELPVAYRSAWRAEGIRENVGEAADEDGP
jgi:hypothetical protein